MDSAKHITSAGYSNSSLKMLPVGTVLLTTRAPIGKVAIAGAEMCCNQGFKNLICSNRVYNEYLYRYLKFRALDLQALGRGATFKELSKKDVEDFEMLLPSMERQTEAVRVLSRIETAEMMVDLQIINLQNLVKSRFTEMFGELAHNSLGYREVKFYELGSWASGGTPPRSNPSFFQGEINWYSAGELNSLYLPASKERITFEAIATTSAKLFPANSLFIGMYDTAALKLGIATCPCSSNQACANLTPNENVDLIWLYYAISQLRSFLLEQRSGCRQKNLSLRKIKDFDLPLPPLPLQREFAGFAERAAKLEFVAQRQIADLVQYNIPRK